MKLSFSPKAIVSKAQLKINLSLHYHHVCWCINILLHQVAAATNSMVLNRYNNFSYWTKTSHLPPSSTKTLGNSFIQLFSCKETHMKEFSREISVQMCLFREIQKKIVLWIWKETDVQLLNTLINFLVTFTASLLETKASLNSKPFTKLRELSLMQAKLQRRE